MATILVIEDDAAVHDLLTETLAQQAYTVVDAYSGTEGLLRFRQQPVDLVLLDLMLPGMAGELVIRELRQQSQVPVIALSAKIDQATKLDLLTHGADDYVTKPFVIDELLARIAIQLRHRATTKDPVDELTYQAIVMNLETRMVTVAGQPVHLTAHEFELLKLFLRHPHKVFSRANLYESVWQALYLANDKTVNVHVSNLRQKLNQSGSHYIQTVWGIGFKLS